MNKIRILIADDQSLVRDGLTSLLGFRTELEVAGTAENGQKAVMAAQKLKPEVILMDIRMPVMDGITALRRIKEQQPDIRVIMLTTFDDQEYITKSLQAGAAGYLLKDIPIDDLVRAIQQVNNGTFQAAEAVISRLAAVLEGENRMSVSDSDIRQLKECYGELSEKEQVIFKSLGKGLTNREIAEQMNLTEGTVKNYMTNILAAFDMRDRTQIALIAYKLGYR